MPMEVNYENMKALEESWSLAMDEIATLKLKLENAREDRDAYLDKCDRFRALILTALKENGGPIDSSDTIDFVDYVMVRRVDFEALETALKG
jgi:hypothetical protein